MLRAVPPGSVVRVKVNSLVCMSPSALVLMQARPPLLFWQNLWYVSRLMVATAGSVELWFFPSITTITVTPRFCARSSASEIQSMLSEWIAPRMVEPAGAASISRRSSLWMV